MQYGQKGQGTEAIRRYNRYAGAKDHNGCKLAAGVQNVRNVMSQVGHTHPLQLKVYNPQYQILDQTNHRKY